jgi:hypothetical protein
MAFNVRCRSCHVGLAAYICAFLLLLCVDIAVPQPSQLEFPLKIEITQTGFAGDSGSRWLVQPDGRWTANRIQSGQPDIITAEGTLSSEEMARLRQVLDRCNFSSMAAVLGDAGRANPQKLTVSWGAKTTVYVTQGGTDLLMGSNSDTPGSCLVRLAQEVRALTTH